MGAGQQLVALANIMIANELRVIPHSNGPIGIAYTYHHFVSYFWASQLES